MWLGFRSSLASSMHYILDPSLLPEPAQILSAQRNTSFLSFKHFLYSSNSTWFNIPFMAAIFSYSLFLWTLCVCGQLLSHTQLFVTSWRVSVHEISQARTLEWVAISFSRIFLAQEFNPCLLHLPLWQEDSLPLHHLGSPLDSTVLSFMTCLCLIHL